ncbi:MAG: T9SS type A sorting domain-containing protein, partial [Puia sp.]
YGVFSASSKAYVATYSATPLPVTFLNFTATKQGTSDALLKWTTTMEENNKGFEILRSSDASNWTVVGFVSGAGNSQTQVNYQYTDMNLSSGTYYYKLRQVDFDNNSAFSKIAQVTIDGGLMLELLQNRPNPFTSTTIVGMVIPTAGRVQLLLYDQMGRQVQILMDEFKAPGTYQVQVNKNGLGSGIYYYKMNTMNQSLVKKMTVL